jgi:farnesyl diphosphate synthase
MFSTTSRKPSRASAAEPELNARLRRLRDLIDARLAVLVPAAEDALGRAMRAGVVSPGKRLRPALVLLIGELWGRSADELVDLACAVEVVHAASLVLDDLPCMDDAKLRRGEACVHVQFGESVAILAAFALLARAQVVLGQGLAAAGIAPSHREELAWRLGEVVETLCRGQALDLTVTGADLELLEGIHAGKTGALFELAAHLGGVSAGIAGARLTALLAYAHNIGLAFQVRDDLLDHEGTSETMGKAAGRDAALGRSTFVSVLGTEAAQQLCDELIAAAMAALEPLGSRAAPLAALADYVRTRPS